MAALAEYSSRVDVSKSSIKVLSADLPFSTREKIGQKIQYCDLPPEWVLSIPDDIREMTEFLTIPEKASLLKDLPGNSGKALSWLAVKYPEELENLNVAEQVASGKFMSAEALYRIGRGLKSCNL